jgi:threonylcarbamoyladenosine tRNA methylthiotransferase MtaB
MFPSLSYSVERKIMPTFSLQTLGCKVNHYESEQVAELLRQHGYVQSTAESADLKVINTCSVTCQAASKSAQAVRRATRGQNSDGQTVVMGCWATSNPREAAAIPGVAAVLTHRDDVRQKLGEFLGESPAPACSVGTNALPLLEHRQSTHQRAFLKIQDGCDAHCTYCIIPKLRSKLWSKPIEDAVREATRLVEAGHREIILSGIFLGAYGQQTALRRRQDSQVNSLADLIEALCTRVPNLLRLRLSSLEPGDLNERLLATLRSHPQVVPHFHLPLQSGSNTLLRRMNRQYTQQDFVTMLEKVFAAFDRPALTTDIIVGFPGETENEFNHTLDIVRQAKFIHVHAFPFSPRPGTAAARWQRDFIYGPIVGKRIELLNELAAEYSLDFRKSFLGETVQVTVEREDAGDEGQSLPSRHGRCERYFDVQFPGNGVRPGDAVTVRVERVDGDQTFGSRI